MLSSGSSSSTSSPPPPFFFFFFFSFSSSDCRDKGSKDREEEGSDESEMSPEVQRWWVKPLRRQNPPGWVASLALSPFTATDTEVQSSKARCPGLQKETQCQSPETFPSCPSSLSSMYFPHGNTGAAAPESYTVAILPLPGKVPWVHLVVQ